DWVFDQTANNLDGNLINTEWSDDTPGIKTSAFSDDDGNYLLGGIYYGSGETFSVIPEKKTPLGSSIKFDGTNPMQLDYDDSYFTREDFTISFWYNMHVSGKGENVFLQKYIATTGKRYAYFNLIKNSSNKFYIEGWFGSNSIKTNETAALNKDTWYYIAVVFDQTNLVLKVFDQDGNLYSQRTEAINGLRTEQTPANSFLGTDSRSYIDEFMFWKSARTDEQLLADMKGKEINLDADGTYEDDADSNLVTYLKMNEGSGSYLFDESLNGLGGTLSNSISWNEDEMPLDDSFIHEFSPTSKYVTLNNSNTSKDDVIFNDISLINVSGYVRFEGTSCYQDSVEILVDGESADSPIYTDENGKFIAELEPGSNAVLSPYYSDHTFSLAGYEVVNLNSPISGILIENNTKRELDVNVFGGECRYPIRPETGDITVTLTSLNGCFEQELTTPTSGDFTYTFSDVPPQDYTVTIDHPVAAIRDALPGQPISLIEGDAEMDFMYQADLQVAVTNGFTENDCGDIVLAKETSYTISIQAFESYYDLGIRSDCAVDTGSYKISDELSGIGDTTVVFGESRESFNSSTNKTSYSFITGQPNIISPYKKQIQIVATDKYGRQAITSEEAIVLGSRLRESTFVSHTPEETPVMILRDPPGDQSYGFIENGTSFSNTVTVGIDSAEGYSSFLHLSKGPKITISTGLGVSKDNEWDLVLDETFNWGSEDNTSDVTSDTYEFSTSRTITTAEDPIGGDVILGGAINLVYGITDNLEYNEENCEISVGQELRVEPVGFNTSYIYSVHHIKEILIPQLQLLIDAAGTDSTSVDAETADSLSLSIDRWNAILDFNDSLKLAATFSENISIDAYSSLEYYENVDSSSTFSVTFEDKGFSDYMLDVGLMVDDVGINGGLISFSQDVTVNETSTTNGTTSTYGYFIGDDDPGDFFSVDIKKDPVYGTFVFDTKNGQSKCPWEENTLPREGVQVNPSAFNAVNVLPNEAAVFNLELGNTSQSDETWGYSIKLLNETNPDGAIVKINGFALSSGAIEYVMDPGVAYNATVTIEKGPHATEYEDITLQFYSACEADIADQFGQNPKIHQNVTFSVSFIDACSEINISSLEDNWLVTSGQAEDTLWVTVDSYSLWNDDVTELKLQYRKRVLGSSSIAAPIIQGSANNGDQPKIDLWIDVPESVVDSFSIRNLISENSPGIFDTTSRTENYSIVPWEIKNLPDGVYELRAVVECGIGDAAGVSTPVLGEIDRTGPALVGTPSPIDGVLELDDLISFVFDENIDCDKMDPVEDVKLINLDTGADVGFEYNCTDNTIVFTIDDLNKYVENATLKATVSNIHDGYGNGISDKEYSWEFYVNRNPVSWDGGDIDIAKLDDEEKAVTRKISNTGGKAYSYKISDVADWLTVSPMEGTVQAKSAVTLNFEVGAELSHGIYTDTLYAETSEGTEAIIVAMEVLCNPPTWEIQPQKFEHSMVIVANLKTADVISEDLCDVVYAFVGDELRGVANLQYFAGIDSNYSGVEPYQVFMTVYSDTTEGEVIVLRVWDASEKQIVTQLGNYYDFLSNDVIGDPTAPELVETSSLALQETFFVGGWNWFSPNLTNTDMSLNYTLSALNPGIDAVIKSNYLFSDYSLGSWIGGITELSDESMYMIKLTSDDTLQYFGEPVDLTTSSISINGGWNWIGFQPSSPIDINEALASLDLANGDVIKSQKHFSTFVENVGWIGSLVELSPQGGYKLKVSQSDTLVYPTPSSAKSNTGSISKMNGNSEEDKQTANPDGWDFNPNKYEFTMNIVGELSGSLIDSLNTNDFIGAFVDGECRGIASPIFVEALGKDLIFLTIFSNQTTGDTISFKAYSSENSENLYLDETIKFKLNEVLGSAAEPYTWSPKVTGIWDEGFIPEVYSLSQNYPNPFNPTTQFEFGLPENATVSISIFNMLGQEVKTLINEQRPAGYYKVQWNGTNNSSNKIVSGVYVYRIVAKGLSKTFVETKKLILLK
ncbi:MAG: T9SS type A sorting domain-containing protein, partial [Melioribacteraceae bacterium]|nr:T9SS type A sorting domain-containing protein [Melioribacteraceae bacterium]